MNLRTPSRTSALIAAIVCAFTLPAFSQPVITSLSQNGVLVCSQLAPDSIATVEWAASIDAEATWQDLQSATVDPNGSIQVSVAMIHTSPTFFRVRGTGWPPNMALIPEGSFTMGDSFSGGLTNALPLHSVYVSAFYMDRYEVTKAIWDEVYNWAVTNGYSFEYGAEGKAANHPAHSTTWFDAVKWCNARSEKEGKTPAYYTDPALSQRYRSGWQVDPFVNWNAGYRLPTEAEWEKAARGGVSGRRFSWSNTDNITHTWANYFVRQGFGDENYYFWYDTSPTTGYHPTFNDGVSPYTSPVSYFAPNGYGLYDVTGNVFEWCWDWYGPYRNDTQTDPRGPESGSGRVLRGGGWSYSAIFCQVADRYGYYGIYRHSSAGFRTVLPTGP